MKNEYRSYWISVPILWVLMGLVVLIVGPIFFSGWLLRTVLVLFIPQESVDKAMSYCINSPWLGVLIIGCVLFTIKKWCKIMKGNG